MIFYFFVYFSNLSLSLEFSVIFVEDCERDQIFIERCVESRWAHSQLGLFIPMNFEVFQEVDHDYSGLDLGKVLPDTWILNIEYRILSLECRRVLFLFFFMTFQFEVALNIFFFVFYSFSALSRMVSRLKDRDPGSGCPAWTSPGWNYPGIPRTEESGE